MNIRGPVILKRGILGIFGARTITHSLLIGMISSYIPYQDLTISTQAQRSRTIFEEDSGLAEVAPLDVIKETMDSAVLGVGSSGIF